MNTTVKQFLTVLRFELGGYFKQKSMMVITLLFVAVVGVLLSWPRISAALDSGGVSSGRDVLAVFDEVYGFEVTGPLLEAAFPDREAVRADTGNVDILRELVINGTYDAALVVIGPNRYQYVVGDTTIYDSAESVIRGILTELSRASALTEAGLPPEAIGDILTPAVQGETVQIGKNQSENFFYTYIMIFLLYMAILIYGQLVASGVVEEKSSRAMELLITSARPPALMFGKVIAAGLTGLSQMTVLLGAGLIFYRINQSVWGGNPIIESIFAFPPALLAYLLLFFVLGFFLYSFLYAALASLCTRAEEVGTMIMPVTFLFIAFFFASFFTMMSGEMNGAAMRVLSYLPFSSSMAMFIRIAMSRVPWWEIAISVTLLLGSTIGVGYLAAGIYRLGVLLYGKPPKPAEVFKLLRGQGKKGKDGKNGAY